MNNNDSRSYNILRKMKIISIINVFLIFKDNGIKGIISKLKYKKKRKKDIEISKSINYILNSNLKFESFKINIVFESKKLYSKVIQKFNFTNNKYNLFILDTDIDNCAVDYQILTKLELISLFEERSFIFITVKESNIAHFSSCINIIFDNEIVNNINEVLNSYNLIKLLSNYENSNCVTAKTSTFFDFMGTNYYSGGAERYLVDLSNIFNDININFDIYQNADKSFFRKFRGINVIGIKNKNYPMDFSDNFRESQTRKYINMTKNNSQLHVFSAFCECYPYTVCHPSIGISHGVCWDSPNHSKIGALDFWNSKHMFIDSALSCDKLISVDTNTANWFQTIDYDLGNKKTKVIPNYVDIVEFSSDNSYKKKDKTVIVYPRRLYKPRGMYLLLDIVDDLFKKYDNIEIHFVGKGFEEDVNQINKKIKKYPDKLFCYSKEPEKMNEVYKMADISLIPTLYSEGTSLSCLEAMSTGNIVVCTRIGGLTDLVINGINGYMIEPNSDSLLVTLESILDNMDKQDKIKENAILTAQAMNKKRWQQSWKKEICDFGLRKESKNVGLVEFYVKDADNLSKKVIEMIRSELINNNLIYIRSKKKILVDNISFGLCQLVDFNEEVVSKADKIYLEKGIKINRKEKKIILI